MFGGGADRGGGGGGGEFNMVFRKALAQVEGALRSVCYRDEVS